MLAAQLGVSSILDIPCGDFNWTQSVNFGSCRYFGADIVEDLVSRTMNSMQAMAGNS
jgi:hypothetical protein